LDHRHLQSNEKITGLNGVRVSIMLLMILSGSVGLLQLQAHTSRNLRGSSIGAVLYNIHT